MRGSLESDLALHEGKIPHAKYWSVVQTRRGVVVFVSLAVFIKRILCFGCRLHHVSVLCLRDLIPTPPLYTHAHGHARRLAKEEYEAHKARASELKAEFQRRMAEYAPLEAAAQVRLPPLLLLPSLIDCLGPPACAGVNHLLLHMLY